MDNNIENQILDIAREKDMITTAIIQTELKSNYSRQYLHRKINDLVTRGLLLKRGSTKSAFYTLPEKYYIESIPIKQSKTIMTAGAQEDLVLEEMKTKLVGFKKLEKNIKSAFDYAFSEILNNAIEHSRSKKIDLFVSLDKDNLVFTIRDFGVGIFKKVKKERSLDSELAATQDILKGKTTTAPKSHSGEGIFFTSKIANIFIIESYSIRLIVDNNRDDIFIGEYAPKLKGTRVTWQIKKTSPQKLSDIFQKYQTPGSYKFDKTKVKVKLYTLRTSFISRSQARRLLTGLDKFSEIILDFDKVYQVGQGFVDEIFRVFKQRNPKIKITSQNTNKIISFMIDRAKPDTNANTSS